MKRPYKEAWPVERALATLHEGAGQHFDSSMIAAFENCLPRILDTKTLWEQRAAREDS